MSSPARSPFPPRSPKPSRGGRRSCKRSTSAWPWEPPRPISRCLTSSDTRCAWRIAWLGGRWSSPSTAGEWCPYCNLELRALQAHLGRITELGASLLAISPQAPTDALSLVEKHQLGFEVLSDVDQAVIRAYRLQYTIPKESQEVYRTIFGNDLSTKTADGSWSLPIPATFVLDGRGVVRARHVDPDYRVRMEPDDIVSALRALTTS